MTTQPEVSLTGRAPSAPLDAYVIDQVPAAHIEHALVANLAKALTTCEVVTGVTLVPGGIIQGINSTVTLGAASENGTSACSIYAKVVLGVLRAVSGRTSVIEGRLEIPVTAVRQATMSCLALDFENKCSDPIVNFASSYIALRERSSAVGSWKQMNNLFNFMDITPSTHNPSKLFVSSTDTGSTHRLKFMAKGAYYWVMCTNTPPA